MFNMFGYRAFGLSLVLVFVTGSCGPAALQEPQIVEPDNGGLLDGDEELSVEDVQHDAGPDSGSLDSVDPEDPIEAQLQKVASEPMDEVEAQSLAVSNLEEAGVLLDDTEIKHEVRRGVLWTTVKKGARVFAVYGLDLSTGKMESLSRPSVERISGRFPKAIETFTAGSSAYTTADGVKVRLVSRRHAHRVRGGAIGYLDFKFTKGGETRKATVSGEQIYGEVRVFDKVFSIKQNKKWRVVVRVYPAGGSISLDRAVDMVGEIAKRIGLDPDSSSCSDDGQGAYEFILRRGNWFLGRGVIGAFTGRLVSFDTKY